MRPRPIHLVGVGGAGMSGLARLAVQAGYRVSGTDREDSAALAALAAIGVRVRVGHDAAHIPADTDAVVVSTAIPPNAPELLWARARGVPVLHRADLLAELMVGHRGIAVAGAHGKSTTSAMLLACLGDASACIGATIDGGEGTGAIWGRRPWFVAEADESDRSLLRLRPEAAVVTNVDHDHHATYADIGEVEEVFRSFVAALPGDGVLVLGDDDRARRLGDAASCPVCQIGPGNSVDGRLVPLELAVPGRHNLHNAACAIAMAEWCGVPIEEATARLRGFRGVGRRFEHRGEAGGVRVVDDYAHHPAELAATLAAAREQHDGRVVAIFQPHLYSRTRALSRELGAALGEADLVVVTEVYAAREAPLDGVSGRQVADAVPPPSRAIFAPTLQAASETILPELRPGDLVLTLGAGDITALGEDLLAKLPRTVARPR